MLLNTALFANSMLGFEFTRLGRRVSRIKKDVADLHDELNEEEMSIDHELKALAESIKRIEKKISNKDN